MAKEVFLLEKTSLGVSSIHKDEMSLFDSIHDSFSNDRNDIKSRNESRDRPYQSLVSAQLDLNHLQSTH